jgi:hypothetical protein
VKLVYGLYHGIDRGRREGRSQASAMVGTVLSSPSASQVSNAIEFADGGSSNDRHHFFILFRLRSR